MGIAVEETIRIKYMLVNRIPVKREEFNLNISRPKPDAQALRLIVIVLLSKDKIVVFFFS